MIACTWCHEPHEIPRAEPDWQRAEDAALALGLSVLDLVESARRGQRRRCFRRGVFRYEVTP